MASVDLISPNRLAKSRQIRKGMIARGLKPLTTPRHIQKDIMKFAKHIRIKMKASLKERIKNDQRFTVTTDEATKFNRRYSVVNLHMPGGEHMGLGKIRVRGKFGGDKAADLVCK